MPVTKERTRWRSVRSATCRVLTRLKASLARARAHRARRRRLQGRPRAYASPSPRRSIGDDLGAQLQADPLELQLQLFARGARPLAPGDLLRGRRLLLFELLADGAPAAEIDDVDGPGEAVSLMQLNSNRPSRDGATLAADSLCAALGQSQALGGGPVGHSGAAHGGRGLCALWRGRGLIPAAQPRWCDKTGRNRHARAFKEGLLKGTLKHTSSCMRQLDRSVRQIAGLALTGLGGLEQPTCRRMCGAICRTVTASSGGIPHTGTINVEEVPSQRTSMC